MSNTSWNNKVDIVTDWVTTINQHWNKLGELGQLEGLGANAAFWNECISNKSNSDWQAWLDVALVLRVQYPESFQKYPYCDADLKFIEERLNKEGSKPISRKRAGLFRAVMNMKDVINHANGTPTKQYATVTKARTRSKSGNVFNELFEIEK